MSTIAHVFVVPLHPLETYGQIVVRAAQQEARADRRLSCPRVVASEVVGAHVVCGPSAVSKGLDWKNANRILAPRALGAGLLAIEAFAAFLRLEVEGHYLVINASGP